MINKNDSLSLTVNKKKCNIKDSQKEEENRTDKPHPYVKSVINKNGSLSLTVNKKM